MPVESLALASLAAHEKLAAVSIHQAIKARREKQGLTLADLAEKVSELEGRSDKPLAWQTIQQWEREGGTSPKRTRLEHVAKALKTTVNALLNGDASDQPSDELASPETELTLAHLVAQMRAIRSRDPERFNRLVAGVSEIEASLRHTDDMLRNIHGVKNYVTQDRAEETLGQAPAPTPVHTDDSYADADLAGGMSGFDTLGAPELRTRTAPKAKNRGRK